MTNSPAGTPLLRLAVPSLAALLIVSGCRKERVEEMPVGGNATAFLSVAGDDAAARADWTNYGDPVSLDAAGTVTPVAKVLADPSAYEGKVVTVEGVITQVCAKRGCWVRIGDSKDAEKSLFVKLTCKAEGLIVPLDAAGDLIRARGEIAVETVDEATARHYAEDAGKSKEEIEKIVGPQKSLDLKTVGVWVAETK